MAELNGFAIKIKKLGADHTYVTSSDGGIWPCWGRSSGGRLICSGSGSSKKSDCLSKKSSHAGLIYGVSGVCHQTANRILYPAKKIVSEAHGYWASVAMYGTYGTSSIPSAIEWKVRKNHCQKIKGDLNTKLSENKPKISENSVQKSEISLYIDKVNDLYIEEVSDQVLSKSKKIDFLGQELELMADYKLGATKDSYKITALRKLQANLLSEKEILDDTLSNDGIDINEYAEKINKLMFNFLKESEIQLGKETHIKLFEIAPDTVFNIIDADILAENHKVLAYQ